jgi:hypothetical protein
MFLSILIYTSFYLFLIGVVLSQEVLKSKVKRSAIDDIQNPEATSLNYVKEKADLPIGKVHTIENVEDRFHCVEKKDSYKEILENGLNCEPIKTIYILKSNIYSCYNLYLPIWFYGFLPDTANPKNFTYSTLIEGFLPNGNGTDLIQSSQKKTDQCIFYMR